jgi:hypothetical protein
MTLTPNGPATARSRPARLGTDIRATLYQAIADLAETALWLPGRYAAEHDRAADILARMSGDLAHLQALDDAISYRAARLRAPCRTCRPGVPCHAHGRDLSLLDTYHELAHAAIAARNAGKCPDKAVSAAKSQEQLAS